MTAEELAQVNDIVVVGVGGQGILLATDIIANVFIASGYDVKKSEVHGMAQRGGSVESHVRRDRERVSSPLISFGQADVVLSFELMEALRYAHFVRPDGAVLYSTQRIPTVAMAAGESEYPADIGRQLETRCRIALPVDAMSIARRTGNPRVANTVLVGALSHFTEVSADIWQEAVLDRVPEKAREVNRRAFAAGVRVAETLIGA